MDQPQHFCLFVFSRFLAFHRLVQVLTVAAHGFPPLFFFNSPDNGLAEGMPIRVDWQRPPSILHIGGVDEGAHYTVFMRLQCELLLG